MWCVIQLICTPFFTPFADNISVPDLFEENKPTVYTAYRSSSMSKEEKAGVDHMFEMMMASKQQLLLRKAMLNE